MRFDVMVVVLPSLVVFDCPPQALSFSPGSTVPLVSQPLSALGAAGSEQSLYGAAHTGWQSAPEHDVDVAPAVEQARPQAPQLALSPVVVLVVQPAVLSVAHAAYGGVHVGLQNQ